MKAKRRSRLGAGSSIGTTAFFGRGDRHCKDLWKEILPATRAKLVADGLFNEDGSVTAKGLALSKEQTT